MYLTTNETPQDHFFGFSCLSSIGASIPTWLATPGPEYIKHQVHVHTSKIDRLVDEVEILQPNPHYVHVHYTDSRDMTVPQKHLVPKGQMPKFPDKAENMPLDTHKGQVPESPEEAEYTCMPLDTHVSVMPNAELSSVPQPEPIHHPELKPVQNEEIAPVCHSQQVCHLVADSIYKCRFHENS